MEPYILGLRIDARYCVQTLNNVVLVFRIHYIITKDTTCSERYLISYLAETDVLQKPSN